MAGNPITVCRPGKRLFRPAVEFIVPRHGKIPKISNETLKILASGNPGDELTLSGDVIIRLRPGINPKSLSGWPSRLKERVATRISAIYQRFKNTALLDSHRLLKKQKADLLATKITDPKATLSPQEAQLKAILIKLANSEDAGTLKKTLEKYKGKNLRAFSKDAAAFDDNFKLTPPMKGYPSLIDDGFNEDDLENLADTAGWIGHHLGEISDFLGDLFG